MIKCLAKKKNYKTLWKKWNETRVNVEATKKEYTILENHVNTVKSAFARITEEYEKAKSKFGDASVEKILAEKDGREVERNYENNYNYTKSVLMDVARRYNLGKKANEEVEKLLVRYNEEKEKCELEEENARRVLGLYLTQYTNDLLWERKILNNELSLYIEECEARFGHWYDISEVKDYSNAIFCGCVFCGKTNYDIPWYNKNYICKTYLSRGWTNEHQEALNKINSMKETLKEIQELLEIICFAKENHEYGERHSSFMGPGYYECQICGYTEYEHEYEDF